MYRCFHCVKIMHISYLSRSSSQFSIFSKLVYIANTNSKILTSYSVDKLNFKSILSHNLLNNYEESHLEELKNRLGGHHDEVEDVKTAMRFPRTSLTWACDWDYYSQTPKPPPPPSESRAKKRIVFQFS